MIVEQQQAKAHWFCSVWVDDHGGLASELSHSSQPLGSVFPFCPSPTRAFKWAKEIKGKGWLEPWSNSYSVEETYDDDEHDDQDRDKNPHPKSRRRGRTRIRSRRRAPSRSRTTPRDASPSGR